NCYVDYYLVIIFRDAGDLSMLVISHMHTFFPDGMAAERPFTIKDGRAYGPGVIDMQSSLVTLLYAVKALYEANDESYKNVTIILNSDEEIGSPTSRGLIEELSEGKQYALVM